MAWSHKMQGGSVSSCCGPIASVIEQGLETRKEDGPRDGRAARLGKVSQVTVAEQISVMIRRSQSDKGTLVNIVAMINEPLDLGQDEALGKTVSPEKEEMNCVYRCGIDNGYR